MTGKVKVVGVLPGWPFPVKEDPTEVDTKPSGVSRLLDQVKSLVK